MNENITAEELDKLASSPSSDIRAQVATHPNISTSTLAALARDSNAFVRWSAALNPNVSSAVLDLLATDPDSATRTVVATHPKISANSFNQLATDNQFVVRAALVRNPSVPDVILKMLAADENINVRAAVAAKVTAPDVLETFVKDPAWQVRYSLGSNLELPETILTLLASDTDRRVRYTVAVHSSTPPEILTLLADDEVDIDQAIAANPNTPIDVLLSLLGRAETTDIVENVLTNSHVPVSVLEQFSTHSEPEFRCSVAMNVSTPLSVLKKLTADVNKNVAVAANETRINHLHTYIESLPPHLHAQASLLVPSFTGWPAELETVLNNLNTGQLTQVRSL